MEELKKNEAYAIAEIIEANIFRMIRNDEDIDNMLWLQDVIHGYEKLSAYSGYGQYKETDWEKVMPE